MCPQCAFLIWCMIPGPSNGSNLIYTRIIRPFFLRNEAKLDNVVKDITDRASEAADKFKDEGKKTYLLASIGLLRFGTDQEAL